MTRTTVTRTGAAALVAGTALIGAGLATAATASAHTPQASASCAGVSYQGSAYETRQGDATPNHLTVTIDGATAVDKAFGTSVGPATVPFTDPTITHTWTVDIAAWNDPDGTKGYSHHYAGTQAVCEQPTETTPPSETTSPTSPPTETQPPTTPPTETQPPTQTQPPTSTTTSTTTAPTTTTTTTTPPVTTPPARPKPRPAYSSECWDGAGYAAVGVDNPADEPVHVDLLADGEPVDTATIPAHGDVYLQAPLEDGVHTLQVQYAYGDQDEPQLLEGTDVTVECTSTATTPDEPTQAPSSPAAGPVTPDSPTTTGGAPDQPVRAASTPTELAYTGTNLAPGILAGLALIVAGALALILGRARRPGEHA